MRFPKTFILTGLIMAGLAVPGGAALARAYPGQEFSVNAPQAGGEVLFYPGGQYRRVVQPLLQPGEKLQDMGAISSICPPKAGPPHQAREREA